MTPAAINLRLSSDDIAYFQWSCEITPNFESPLKCDRSYDPDDIDPEPLWESLNERGLLKADSGRASEQTLERLHSVSECEARVSLRVHEGQGVESRDFYLAGTTVVEYQRSEDDVHLFGPPRSESALAIELAQLFRPRQQAELAPIKLSAGEYFVFAMFARDLRASAPTETDESHMSVEEVLAYFDEPEPVLGTTAKDDAWSEAVATLIDKGVIKRSQETCVLRSAYHPLAREIVAEHQHTVIRFDFLDEHWLVREVNLYPSGERVYRLGTDSDGSVLMAELDAVQLGDIIAGVVTALPDLLEPEVKPSIRAPGPM
ncbi:hypothetical protein KAI87_00290 [Myxococcota bacterium]|nr:hypothetical protein [Myxococcota bacterium]